MKRCRIKLKLLLMAGFVGTVLILSPVMPVMAETRYISDQLIISVREGQADDSQIIGYLMSDTPVEVIEEQEDPAIVKVETPEGMVGWVKKRFLVSETPKSVVIEELKAQLKNLEDKLAQLSQNTSPNGQTEMKAEYESKIGSLQEEVNREKHKVSTLQNELKQASTEYKKLLEQQRQPSDLKKQLLVLKDKNQELMRDIQEARLNTGTPYFSGNMKWFLSGAGVLVLGLIIGRSLRRKPRYRY